MSQPLYTIGYSGMKPIRLAHIVNRLGAVLVDIRYSATSQVPQWRKGALQKLMDGNYVHLPSLGNVLYKSGDHRIQIADYQSGKQLLIAIDAPAVLLCGCKEPDHCHRTVVAELLRAEGFKVEELTPAYINDLFNTPAAAAVSAIGAEQAPPAPKAGTHWVPPPRQLSLFDS